MKYTIVCFTFNKDSNPFSIGGSQLTLRNNWFDEVKDDETLGHVLDALGLYKLRPYPFPNTNKVVKMSSDFTLENTRIIVHIIKNN